MAGFPADINLKVTGTQQVLSEINRVEREIEELNKKSAFNVAGGKSAARQRAQLLSTDLERLKLQQKIETAEQKAWRRATQRHRIRMQNLRAERRERERLAAEIKRSQAARVQNAALGVGFPLLFGGGAGSVVGGGLGAFGGFGGSVIGSALGAQFDTFTQGLRDVASALPDASAALDAFEDAGYRVDASQRAVVDSLVERGLLLDAEKAAIEAINEVLGQGGIENIQKLNTAIDNATKKGNALAKIFAQEVTPAIAGYIDLQTETANILGELAPKLGGFNIQLASLLSLIPFGLGGAVKGGVGALSNRGRNIDTETSPNVGIPGFKPGVGFGNDTDINAKELAERALRELEVQLQVLRNRNIFTEEYNKLNEESEKLIRRATAAGARALERELKRLELLRERVRLQNELDRIETASIQRQIEFDNKESQARIEKDAYGLIELRRERELAELAERRAKALARLKPGEEGRIPEINNKFDALEDRVNNKALNDTSELIEKRAEAAKEEILALRQQTELVEALTEKDKRRVKLNQDLAKIRKNEAGYEAGFVQQLLDARLALFASEEATRKLVGQTEELNNLYKGIGDSLTQGLVDGLVLAIQGTENLGEAFKDLAADILLAIGRALILKAITAGIGGIGGDDGQGIFSALSGTLTSRANGGELLPGQPAIVGERGAELFIPGKSGTVVPADVFEASRQAIAGNGPVGGDSEAFAQNSIALGNSASITKENTLVREMGMRENEPIDVRYDSTVINNVSYVSEQQFQEGMKAAVAQSKASVFRDLKNKPRARSGIGI